MTTWADTKHQAIQAFNGELPNATTEQDILDAFQQEPVAVLHALDLVTTDFQQGKLRSGWAIWRKRCLTATQTRDIEVNTSDRPRAIALAETWLRNAGGYCETEAEIIAHLFGPAEMTPPLAFLEQVARDTDLSPGRHLYHSLLQSSVIKTRAEGPQQIPESVGFLTNHDTPELRQRMVNLWQQQRPRFIAAEAAAIERQYEQAQALKRIRKAISGTGSPIDLELHTQRIASEVDRARYGIDPHRDDYIDQLADTHIEDEAA
jgi:hypothetical protein